MYCHECGIFAANRTIRKLKESGQIGYSDHGKILTYDGSFGENFRVDGMSYIRMCEAIKAEDITSISGLINGEETTIKASALEITIVDDNTTTVAIDGVIAVYLLSTADESKEVGAGTYVLNMLHYGTGITRIELAETIHPIDQKYLPNHRVEMGMPLNYFVNPQGAAGDSVKIFPVSPELEQIIMSAIENCHPINLIFTGKDLIDEIVCQAVYHHRERETTYVFYVGNFTEMFTIDVDAINKTICAYQWVG